MGFFNTIPKKPGVANFIIRQIYTCFGLGLMPKAPGTFGTLLGIPLYFLFVRLGWEWYVAGTLFVFFLGWWASNRAEVDLDSHDDHRAVIDEVLGYLVTMVPLPHVSVLPCAFIWGFFLFRFFDILKPGPIGWIDREVSGGFGVMFDDFVAGIFAWVTMFLMGLLYSAAFL
ncbi:MAG: phosphatidylglycerophosphatase A [Deltaproteobacteria bacterium]|jgi:phosphatidylglycerophosphatase A|nr:phosphatidylglycerophosphatase A [Deltaproteobacteria bacterium]